MQYPTKGGFVEFRPKVIVFTSNFPPKQWYDWDSVKADFNAFQRRIDEEWEYFLPETPEHQRICDEREFHCLVRPLKGGDWHPQLSEFKVLDWNPDQPTVFGVPKDEIPVTQDLDAKIEFYESLLKPSVREAKKAFQETQASPGDESIEEIFSSSDDEDPIDSSS